jgi:hypothetical protein
MKESLKKIEELKNQLNAVKSELQKEFKAELKKIFVDNPTLDSVEMYINNHEFNDGGATSFYIGYEDLKIVVEGEEVEREWDNKTKEYVENPVLESLIELFGDTQCIHEDLYGDEYEHLSITREDVLNY